MLDIQKVAEKIRNLRIEKGFSQNDLAEKLYVSRQAISKWEVGQTLPSVDNLVQLMELYDVSVDEILCLDVELQINPKDPFTGQNRQAVMRRIALGEITIDLLDIFHLLSTEERYQILKAIKNQKIVTDINNLLPRLSPAEGRYLLGENYPYHIRR